MSNSYQTTETASGLRVISEAMSGIRSVAVGMFIAAGPTNEKVNEAGFSHLIEHMLFRGTPNYSSLEIDRIFDRMGADLNAATSKENTMLHARLLDQHLETALNVMGEMVWQPTFDQAALDTERQVVLEEIAMYDDEPQSQVFDVFGEALFGSHPLGRPIIGSAQTVSSATSNQLSSFHAERYKPGGVIVAAAGSVDHDQLVEWAEKAVIKEDTHKLPLDTFSRVSNPTAHILQKSTEQIHLCLGSLAFPRSDERRFALRILDTLLGGTPSSRLFQAVREERGLAYTVYSFQSLYAETGQVGVYLGTRPENLREALTVIRSELFKICENQLTEEHLDHAREHLKGQLVLAMESTATRMNRLGASLISGMPILSIEETIAKIDAVGAGELQTLAQQLFDPDGLSVGAIGDSQTIIDALPALVEDVELICL